MDATRSSERRRIGVIGPGSDVPSDVWDAAESVGALVAEAGQIVINGGLGGVMEAASRGASRRGGLVIGLLPGDRSQVGNAYLTVGLATGLGELRNGLLVRACDAVICVGSSWGTLSEVALAVRTGVPLVMLHGWPLPEEGPVLVDSPEQAVTTTALELAEAAPGNRSP